jgi:hypothetical protein
MTNEELLRGISKKLSVLIALQLQKDGDVGVQEHASRLARFGITTVEIAEILDTTVGTVAVAKSRRKKKLKEK